MIGPDETSLVGMLFIVLLLAMALGYVCKRIGIPEFIGGIVAGLLIANVAVGSFSLQGWLGIEFTSAGGPSLNANALTVFFDLGLIFLVFTVGLRIRPSEIRGVGASALWVALLGVVIPFALGAAVILLVLGEPNVYATLFIGVALAASSVGIVSQLVRAYGLVDRTEGHRLLAAALFEDLIALVLLAIVLAFAGRRSPDATDLVIQVGVVLGFAIAFVVAFLFFSEPIVKRWAASRAVHAPHSLEAKVGMLAVAILVCLGVGYVAESFQLAAILGALFAGMALSPLSESYDLERSFGALNTLIVPFFFVYIGLLIDIPGLLSVGLLAVLVTVLAIVGKLLAGLADQHALGREQALMIGTGLMARGEVALIIAIAAAYTGLLSDDYLGAIVVMAIVTTILGPILFGIARRRVAPAPSPTTEPSEPAAGP